MVRRKKQSIPRSRFSKAGSLKPGKLKSVKHISLKPGKMKGRNFNNALKPGTVRIKKRKKLFDTKF